MERMVDRPWLMESGYVRQFDKQRGAITEVDERDRTALVMGHALSAALLLHSCS